MPASGNPGKSSFGPAVGGIAWVVGALQFVVGMGIAQAAWSGPAYSLRDDYISDLGNTACGIWAQHWVCSPAHNVFNVSIVLLGVLLLAGVFLVPRRFPGPRLRLVGLPLLGISGIGAIGVGLFPENVNLTAHALSAGTAFLLSNIGILILGIGFYRQAELRAYAALSWIAGAVGLAALLAFGLRAYGPLGLGGSERLIVAPVLLWTVVVSLGLLLRRAHGTAASSPAVPSPAHP